MRENRTYGSEGGEGKPFPTPISTWLLRHVGFTPFGPTRPTGCYGMRSNLGNRCVLPHGGAACQGMITSTRVLSPALTVKSRLKTRPACLARTP
jgi:hypothetical protein